ncbi:winged helix-turn-helix domain-containing protein [Nitrospira sp. M1]
MEFMTSTSTLCSTMTTQVPSRAVEPTLHFFHATLEVSYGDRTVRLTRKEYGILLELHVSQGRVCSREVLLANVWGRDVFVDSRTIDRHVVQLRRKIQHLSQQDLHVDTIWGVGYRLRMPHASSQESLESSSE